MVSVHTVVSFDFAVGIIPGWHTTIFPPYFVAGAIYSGFAMVLTLMIPVRKFYGLEDIITMRHLNNMAKVTLATGMIVAYGYMMEAFFGYYSADTYENFMIWNRMMGPYAPFYWTLIFCNIITPQFLWFKRIRTSVVHSLGHLDHRQYRHVAGTLRDRDHQSAPRLPALVVGDVLADDLGHLHLRRDARLLHDRDLPVRPRAAHDYDL